MPRLSAIQSKESLKDIALDFGDGDILNLTLDGSKFTVGFMKRLQTIDDNDVPAFADAFFSLVKKWDLTDDKDKVLPLTTETVELLRIETMLEIVTKIRESQNPNPETSTS